jgi:L,D-peptidoglycan transpeptidase YkuD (ErfK/YbiS/YcfS/YnhG family)
VPDQTGAATRVITVVAPATGSTTGTLQAWQKTGGDWAKFGPAIAAHLGSDGLSAHPSESLSATPIGSFTLTQAFGALSNPGSGLPYFRTTLADWWISDPSSSLYNTHQRCPGTCSYAKSPNEHLVTETPYYNFAVVINANMFPTVKGAGSAFFLHVTDGNPTAGCVAIPQSDLVTIMRWLTPAAHPRILIGVG